MWKQIWPAVIALLFASGLYVFVFENIFPTEVFRGLRTECSFETKYRYLLLAEGDGEFQVGYFPDIEFENIDDKKSEDSVFLLSTAQIFNGVNSKSFQPDFKICTVFQDKDYSRCDDKGWKARKIFDVPRDTMVLVKLDSGVLLRGISAKLRKGERIENSSKDLVGLPAKIIVSKRGLTNNNPIVVADCRYLK